MLKFPLDKVGTYFRISFGLEDDALGLERRAQFFLVLALDDAVVNNRHASLEGEMRVGIESVRSAVGRPAGVGNARHSFYRVTLKKLRERFDFADRLAHLKPILREKCQAGA